MGDPVIAKLYKDSDPPVERIIRTDFLMTAFNRDKLGKDLLKRFVDLECGHKEITRNMKRARCYTCHAMMLAGEDYVGFRYPDGLPEEDTE